MSTEFFFHAIRGVTEEEVSDLRLSRMSWHDWSEELDFANLMYVSVHDKVVDSFANDPNEEDFLQVAEASCPDQYIYARQLFGFDTMNPLPLINDALVEFLTAIHVEVQDEPRVPSTEELRAWLIRHKGARLYIRVD